MLTIFASLRLLYQLLSEHGEHVPPDDIPVPARIARFCCSFKGEDRVVLEFRSWRWVTAEWLIDNVADFRRDSYTEVLGG